MADEEPVTQKEIDEFKELMGYGGSVPDSKQNVHTFLHNVATADDTTKLGFLKEDEIGMMPNPIRSYKHLAQFAKDIMKKDGLSKFFGSNSEIVTSTSLSRDGFLIEKAVTQKRELKTGEIKTRKPSSSWFKGKDDKKAEETDA